MNNNKRPTPKEIAEARAYFERDTVRQFAAVALRDALGTVGLGHFKTLLAATEPPSELAWTDRRFDSVMMLGPLTIWIDEGAEGWRIHASISPFVIAVKGIARISAKACALKIIAELARALGSVKP